ncbi:hypothetical protein A3E49_01820 [Candidatus Saccharibacteria bacterium RIFCSPHIGHO2_12_FULL_49_19]|nr:MAG: hypothetical protein A2708_02105 [Candidatus Saccharibacteria bacterium RIFCSPHIGHO2_01_FULL_49_21]OGL36432.1 MAG: hypothetical protein A3E49_01820 [Candidatus Saccharibacteria bacterium RIFCSPHIGHO2_12_FULL_49_19]
MCAVQVPESYIYKDVILCYYIIMAAVSYESNPLSDYKPPFEEYGENPNIDIVYHATTNDRLRGIENGLQPFHEIDDPMGVDNLLDGVRPELIKGLGISRGDALYAHPYIDVIDWLNKKRKKPRKGRDSNFRVGIGVAVNPQETYVFDAFNLGFLTHSMGEALRRGENPSDVESVIEQAQQYWASGVRLDEFRRLYKAQFNENGASYERTDNEILYYPWVMIYPEVLVRGPIDPSRLQWTVSGLRVN